MGFFYFLTQSFHNDTRNILQVRKCKDYRAVPVKRLDGAGARVPEGGGWEGRARCGAPPTFHNALVRAVRHCARAQCVWGRSAGQGKAWLPAPARQRPTDRPTRVAPYPEGREGEKGKDAEVNCQVQLCTVATVAVLSSPRILERQKI